MISTEYVTDGSCRLAVRPICGEMILVHRVQNTAVYRLEAVARIRQGAALDDRHRIGNVGLFHLLFQIDLQNMLVFKTDAHEIFLSCE